jgi:hypothetical protein
MYIAVINAGKIDQSWSTYTLSRRSGMATLDEITKEKPRVSEALARVDAQREKLIGQLGELAAAERVLARYSKGTGPRKRASARAPATPTKTTAPTQSRGRTRTRAARPAGGKRRSSSLGDQVLALATGKTQQEITAECKGVAQTTSAWLLPDTSGLAASKSAMGSSTPLERSYTPRFDGGIRRGVADLNAAGRRVRLRPKWRGLRQAILCADPDMQGTEVLPQLRLSGRPSVLL